MFPPMADPNLKITATEFERLVRDWILKQGGELTSLEVTHDVKVEAHDSTYQIDVLAKFQAFAGAEFIVLIECKKYRNAVERELVQVLHDKVRSVGAHKGMLFTTTGFQSGAIKYAKAHGIALVSIIEGAATYQTRSAFPVATKPAAWLNLPKFALYHVGEGEAGNISMKSLGRADMEINEMFG
ncbi:restriction endonuclease [Pseudomonas syringae pv. tomato]|uniref:Restriction endonuclease n=1 Tax=Pseudomonas syringae pv. tomato TaxID=323 RepID=A0AB36KMS1_PSEUB|nr:MULTISPECIES: restriction endonuclease [Pseudomonas]MEE3923662.1 restriction endonuclease [Pseudomonas viridiflava]KPB75020.1 Orf22 [Pseudomonas syringae pv. maculicola]MBI6850902.1 restriction endonuclease [Pseudomonas syringae]MBX6508815.1 restriction endonuclease [Pseudomonas syringae pv. tomato]MEE3930215.1 restriction endonuclease [Pseudomonas viridiflava]